MSYTELESGYQGLRQQNQNRPGFYVGQDGNIVQYVSSRLFFLSKHFQIICQSHDMKQIIFFFCQN